MNTPKRRILNTPRKFWWDRAKSSAKMQLARFPFIEAPVIRIWRLIKFLLLRVQWNVVALFGTMTNTYDRSLDVDKVCWISPTEIIYCSMREFRLQGFKAQVRGGNWDHLENKFEDLDVYVAFQQVCLEGKSWPETVYYQRTLTEINNGQLPWNCRDKYDLDKRCEYLETLYRKIGKEGYKSRRELTATIKAHDPEMIEHEIEVNIGRDGDLLFDDGAHRLAIAKLVGIEKIPVQINIRHQEWMLFRKEMIQYAKELGGKTYQPLMHIDLHDIPATQEDIENRFEMIIRNVSMKTGRVLDIGANLGYFCHRFEDAGFECYAVEDFPIPLYVMKKLKKADHKKFTIVDKSIFECPDITNMSFDIILALNVFHHFLRTKEIYDRFINLLNQFQTREMFFESHHTSDLMMQGFYKNPSPDDFVKLILQNSNLNKVEFIGSAGDGRPLYKLY